MLSALPATTATQAFIDGELVDAASGATLDTYAPGTGTVIAAVADCGEADVARAASVARAAFDKGYWRKLAPACSQGRAAALRRPGGRARVRAGIP